MHCTHAYKHMLCSVDWYFEVGSHCAVDAGDHPSEGFKIVCRSLWRHSRLDLDWYSRNTLLYMGEAYERLDWASVRLGSCNFGPLRKQARDWLEESHEKKF